MDEVVDGEQVDREQLQALELLRREARRDGAVVVRLEREFGHGLAQPRLHLLEHGHRALEEGAVRLGREERRQVREQPHLVVGRERGRELAHRLPERGLRRREAEALLQRGDLRIERARRGGG